MDRPGVALMAVSVVIEPSLWSDPIFMPSGIAISSLLVAGALACTDLPVATEVRQPECAWSNQQERSQAEAETVVETIKIDSTAASELVIQRMIPMLPLFQLYYKAAGGKPFEVVLIFRVPTLSVLKGRGSDVPFAPWAGGTGGTLFKVVLIFHVAIDRNECPHFILGSKNSAPASSPGGTAEYSPARKRWESSQPTNLKPQRGGRKPTNHIATPNGRVAHDENVGDATESDEMQIPLAVITSERLGHG
jgi:hypothetical protein